MATSTARHTRVVPVTTARFSRWIPKADSTTLHSFGYFDGADPQANLVQATDGNLYGLTSSGGASAAGTVFKMDSSGNLTTLHTFDGSDGAAPLGGLIQAKDGDFYGTTSSGTVFRMDSFGNLTTLHSFGGSDGAAPLGGLIQAKDGDFYGTTRAAGAVAEVAAELSLRWIQTAT